MAASNATRNGHPLRMVGTILDITDRKQAEERIEFLAAHDALTGLPNRLLGRERLRLAVTPGRSSAVEGGADVPRPRSLQEGQ